MIRKHQQPRERTYSIHWHCRLSIHCQCSDVRDVKYIDLEYVRTWRENFPEFLASCSNILARKSVVNFVIYISLQVVCVYSVVQCSVFPAVTLNPVYLIIIIIVVHEYMIPGTAAHFSQPSLGIIPLNPYHSNIYSTLIITNLFCNGEGLGVLCTHRHAALLQTVCYHNQTHLTLLLYT